MAARAPTARERDAIMAAMPAVALGPRFRGGVASVLVEHEGRMLDGAVLVGPPHEVFVRPLPIDDRAGLELFVALLERRRLQLAHDLAGPTTGVLAALETVLVYEVVPSSTRALLEDARAGVLRLTGLLGDRTFLSRQPNAVGGSLAGLVERTARRVKDAIDPDGVLLHLRVDVVERDVRLDAALLEAIFTALLSNAWRLRAAQVVHVSIDGELEAGLLRLSVEDDGRGLDRASLERAGELGFTTRAIGVGLGLFLVRRAVSRAGGAVVIQSLAHGAVSTVLLPAGEPE